MDLVPVFEIKHNFPYEPFIYAEVKDSLPNKSMPICCSKYEAEMVKSMPKYMHQGLEGAKFCRKMVYKDSEFFKGFTEKEFIYIVILKNALFGFPKQK